MGTHNKRRYAVVYGRLIEFFERPLPSGRGEKYREPKRVYPDGYKKQYPNKAAALSAAATWEVLA